MAKKNTSEVKNNIEDIKEENGETSKLFAEVKKSTKDIIDQIKTELTAEEAKKKALYKDEYEKQTITISTIIENAIEVYNNYHSLPPEVIAILEKYESDYG